MKRLAATACVLTLSLAPTVAFADDGAPVPGAGRAPVAAPEAPPRPYRYAGIELNPLATAVHTTGGQVHLGIVSGLAAVVGLGFLARPDTQVPPDSTATVAPRSGPPRLRGRLFEIGARWNLEATDPGDTFRFFGYLQPSFLYESFDEGGLLGERGVAGPGTSFTRVGAALDIGAHLRLPAGFQLSAGLGVALRSGTGEVEGWTGGHSSWGGFDLVNVQDSPWSPRFLLAFGWGL